MSTAGTPHDAPSQAPRPITGVAPLRPHEPPGFRLSPEDHAAFRALEPGTHDPVVLRPSWEGLRLDRPVGYEVVPWEHVASVELLRVPAGTVRVPAVRLRFESGSTVDLADAFSPGAQELPFSVEPGGSLLLRVERMRLLIATIVASAGLGRVTSSTFARAERRVPRPPVTPHAPMLPRWAPPALLVGSVVALSWALDMTLAGALVVTAVLMIHELGHAAAMRSVGTGVRSILFLPFLGAATLPEQTFRSRFDEARVSLAGPATGIPLAFIAYGFWRQGWVTEDLARITIAFSLALNLLNLIPLMPMDGGRVLLSLTASLPRRVRMLASFAPIVLGAILLVLVRTPVLALGVSLLLAFSFAMTRMALRRNNFQEWMHAAGLPLYAVRAAMRDVTDAFTGRAREDVDGGIAPAVLSPRETWLVVVLYLGQVLVLAFATFVAFRVMPELSAGISSW